MRKSSCTEISQINLLLLHTCFDRLNSPYKYPVIPYPFKAKQLYVCIRIDYRYLGLLGNAFCVR